MRPSRSVVLFRARRVFGPTDKQAGGDAADGRTKAVLNSNHVGPPKLKVIEDAIDTLRKKVAWTEGTIFPALIPQLMR
jgi:hypothetical protein